MLALFSRHIGGVAPEDAELAEALDELETATRAVPGHERAADWVAARRARVASDPYGVRADVRGALSGMGSIGDAPLDRELVARVARAVEPARPDDI